MPDDLLFLDQVHEDGIDLLRRSLRPRVLLHGRRLGYASAGRGRNEMGGHCFQAATHAFCPPTLHNLLQHHHPSSFLQPPGGYVFITNLIPLHVLALMLMGKFSLKVYTSYTTWYILGLILSMQVRNKRVVGMFRVCRDDEPQRFAALSPSPTPRMRLKPNVLCCGPFVDSVCGISAAQDQRAHGRAWHVWPRANLCLCSLYSE